MIRVFFSTTAYISQRHITDIKKVTIRLLCIYYYHQSKRHEYDGNQKKKGSNLSNIKLQNSKLASPKQVVVPNVLCNNPSSQVAIEKKTVVRNP